MPGERHFLKTLFDKAVESAQAGILIPGRLPAAPKGKTIVVGAGKAAAAMALAVERNWRAHLSGLVVTPYGHSLPCEKIEVIEAAHPVPDAAGTAAARRLLQTVAGLSADDLVLCLLSGGGSALLTLPAEGIRLQDKQSVTAQLLESGAGIAEINCVRKHLSAIKGGRLAVACSPARVVTLAISDVSGNDISVIASGPAVADATSSQMALDVLRRYGIAAAENVTAHLQNPVSETPKPGEPFFDRAEHVILATADDALKAAAEAAREQNVNALILGDLEGDATELAGEHASLAINIAAGRGALHPPCVLISGGETTVQVRGKGKGGRNTEYALALALALDAHPGISAIACDTDGIDGKGENAGAIITPDTLGRARQHSLDGRRLLDDNDSYRFFDEIGDLVFAGPTRTNVNDFRAILICNQ